MENENINIASEECQNDIKKAQFYLETFLGDKLPKKTIDDLKQVFEYSMLSAFLSGKKAGIATAQEIVHGTSEEHACGMDCTQPSEPKACGGIG